MADSYWKVDDGLIQPASLPPVAGKRPRIEYDAQSGDEIPGYYGRNDQQGMHHGVRDSDSVGGYLGNGQISSFAGGKSTRSISSGVIDHPIDDPHVRSIVGSEPAAANGRVGVGKPEVHLPPNASSTLFVERLPANCTRRELSHIFRQFVGYKEVRLVMKAPRHPEGNPLVLCFVDFVSPVHAATAMDALQVFLEEFLIWSGQPPDSSQSLISGSLTLQLNICHLLIKVQTWVLKIFSGVDMHYALLNIGSLSETSLNKIWDC